MQWIQYNKVSATFTYTSCQRCLLVLLVLLVASSWYCGFLNLPWWQNQIISALAAGPRCFYPRPWLVLSHCNRHRNRCWEDVGLRQPTLSLNVSRYFKFPMTWHNISSCSSTQRQPCGAFCLPSNRNLSTRHFSDIFRKFCRLAVWLCFSMPWISSSDSVQQTSGYWGMGISGHAFVTADLSCCAAWMLQSEQKASASAILLRSFSCSIETNFWPTMIECFPAPFFISKLRSELRWRLLSAS